VSRRVRAGDQEVVGHDGAAGELDDLEGHLGDGQKRWLALTRTRLAALLSR
jgi:hypothetical protein